LRLALLNKTMQKVPYQTDQNNPAVRAYTEAVEKGKKINMLFLMVINGLSQI